MILESLDNHKKDHFEEYQKNNGLLVDSENIFNYTTEADCYHPCFPKGVIETFYGNTLFCYIKEYRLPSLNLKPLLDQMEEIRTRFRTEYNYDPDENFNGTLAEMLCRMPVYCVTEKDINSIIPTTNFFNGKECCVKVPKCLPYRESGVDALGMYLPDSGTILMWVDKIYRNTSHPLLFQQVLLHEFIHAMFDVRNRDGKTCLKTPSKEETYDNLLVLLTYSNSQSGGNVFDLVCNIVQSQPSPYKEAYGEYNAMISAFDGWATKREDIVNMLSAKIQI